MSREGAPSAGRRHRGRELALRVLFELEGSDKEAESALQYQGEELGATADILKFASQLVNGCIEEAEKVNSVIDEASTNWRLDDVGKVERAVLRMCTFELMAFPDTPVPVCLNEAVELSKIYAGPEGSSFVNGVLAKVVSIVRPDGDE